MLGAANIGRVLLTIGIVIAVAGLILIILDRFGMGRLPGDILIKRENLTIFFPITTMIIISIILTTLINLMRR